MRLSGRLGKWKNLPLVHKGLVVVAIPLIPLMLTAGVFRVGHLREVHAHAEVTRTLSVNQELTRTLVLILDAESAVRGYLLTGDRAFLQPYELASSLLEAQFARVRRVVVDAEQLERMTEFELLCRERLGILSDVVASYAPERSNIALLIEGKHRMDAVRVSAEEMRLRQQELLASVRDRAARADRITRAGVYVGAGLGLAGGILAVLLFTRGVATRVEQVTRNAQRLAAGDPVDPLPPSGDEVGLLSVSLEQAAELLRQRDAELQRQVAQVSAANKELEAFSYSVSHDLRAPLRHIAGFTMLLQKNLGARATPEESRYLQTIVTAAARMGQLVDDLLGFARMGRMEMALRDVDLNGLVRDLVEELKRETEGRRITWRIHTLPVVTGDRAMLRQVFSNLLGNAVKYTGTRAEAEIEIGSGIPVNGAAVVFVRDNGVGFDMAYTDKLFGVFQRLHSADEFEGTGIGLANVRRIVQRHGGTAWAEAAPGAGATFCVSLPSAERTQVA